MEGQSQTDARPELKPLTGIRAFAALMVVFFHFYPAWVLLLPALAFLGRFASRGAVGVDLFFILSGFILSYAHSAGQTKLGMVEFRQFLWLRIARILPNHVATLGVLALMVFGAEHFGVALSGYYPLAELPLQVAMVHAWPIIHTRGWNYPSWSISAEWFAYLFIFPAVCVMLGKRLGEAAALILGGALMAAWLLLGWVGGPGTWRDACQVSCEFAAGACFFRLYLIGGRVAQFCQRWASVLFVLFVAFLASFPAASPWGRCGAALVCPAMLLGLASEDSAISKVFSPFRSVVAGPGVVCLIYDARHYSKACQDCSADRTLRSHGADDALVRGLGDGAHGPGGRRGALLFGGGSGQKISARALPLRRSAPGKHRPAPPRGRMARSRWIVKARNKRPAAASHGCD